MANAGVNTPGRRVEEIDLAEWDRLHAVNLRGAVPLARRVLPRMVERGFGRIVLLSSVAAYTGGIIGAHYASSKAGLHGLAHSLGPAGRGVGRDGERRRPGADRQRHAARGPGRPGAARGVDAGGAARDRRTRSRTSWPRSSATRPDGQSILLDGGLPPDVRASGGGGASARCGRAPGRPARASPRHGGPGGGAGGRSRAAGVAAGRRLAGPRRWRTRRVRGGARRGRAPGGRAGAPGARSSATATVPSAARRSGAVVQRGPCRGGGRRPGRRIATAPGAGPGGRVDDGDGQGARGGQAGRVRRGDGRGLRPSGRPRVGDALAGRGRPVVEGPGERDGVAVGVGGEREEACGHAGRDADKPLGGDELRRRRGVRGGGRPGRGRSRVRSHAARRRRTAMSRPSSAGRPGGMRAVRPLVDLRAGPRREPALVRRVVPHEDLKGK